MEYVDHRIVRYSFMNYLCEGCRRRFSHEADAELHVQNAYYRQHMYAHALPDEMNTVRQSLDRILSATGG